MPYADREKQLAFMRDYQERKKERIKELEKVALEKWGYRNEIAILRTGIRLMVSPNFQRLPAEEQLKGVRFLDEFIKSSNLELFEKIRAEYRRASDAIERDVDLVIKRMVEGGLHVQKDGPEVEGLLSRESLVGDSVKEFMRIEEVKKTKPQPGLI